MVLLDVHVPGGENGGGAEILTKSRAYSPDTVFLALSVSDSPQDVAVPGVALPRTVVYWRFVRSSDVRRKG